MEKVQLAAASAINLCIGFDAAEPPVGVVRGDDGINVPFNGWLDLMHAISRLVSTRPVELDLLAGDAASDR